MNKILALAVFSLLVYVLFYQPEEQNKLAEQQSNRLDSKNENKKVDSIKKVQ